MIKECIRYGGILAVICFFASGLLAGVNVLTKPHIAAQAYAAEQDALQQVLPEAAEFEAVAVDGEVMYYTGVNAQGKIIGYAFSAQGKGYASVIETMVGMKADGTIIGITVMNQNETPGLGSRVKDGAFCAQFSGESATGLEEVEALTGATISSRAVIESVKSKAELVLQDIQ